MHPAAARTPPAIALAVLLALAPAAAPAQVQLTPEEMLAVARSAAAVANPAGAARVTLMLDRIEAEHPASDIAGLVRLYRDAGMADGEVVTAIVARLAGSGAAAAAPAAAAPLPGAAAPPAAAPVPLPGATGATATPAAPAPGVPAAPPVAGATVAMPPAPAARAPGALLTAPSAPAPGDAVANPFAPTPAPALPQPGAAAPVPALLPAFEEDERALGLDTAGRREIQGRLAAIGYDPGGADGRFGPRSRAAIAAWQGAQGVLGTGFVSAQHLQALRAQSQAAYPGWLAANPPPRAAAARAGGNRSRSPQTGAPCSVRTTDHLGRRRPECDLR